MNGPFFMNLSRLGRFQSRNIPYIHKLQSAERGDCTHKTICTRSKCILKNKFSSVQFHIILKFHYMQSKRLGPARTHCIRIPGWKTCMGSQLYFSLMSMCRTASCHLSHLILLHEEVRYRRFTPFLKQTL